MKCELQVVQSTREYFQCCNRVIWYQAFIYLVVIGAILSRLRKPLSCFTSKVTRLRVYYKVLVLGMCFFAGGTRHSEQEFGTSLSLLVSTL